MPNDVTLQISDIINGGIVLKRKHFLYMKPSTNNTTTSSTNTTEKYNIQFLSINTQLVIYTITGFVHTFAQITTFMSSLLLIPKQIATVSSIINV